MKGLRNLTFAALVLLVVAVITGNTRSQAQVAAPALTPNDCIKCHSGPPADIASNGAGHRKITCMDCHAGHRPSSKDNIPKCN